IAERKAKGPRKGRFGADPGRPLGEHPDKGGPVVVKNGRYGPYVSHDGINATLPSDMTPETVTLEQALPLLDARAARGTGKKPKRRAGPRKAPTNGASTQGTAKDETKKSAKRGMRAKTAASTPVSAQTTPAKAAATTSDAAAAAKAKSPRKGKSAANKAAQN